MPFLPSLGKVATMDAPRSPTPVHPLPGADLTTYLFGGEIPFYPETAGGASHGYLIRHPMAVHALCALAGLAREPRVLDR